MGCVLRLTGPAAALAALLLLPAAASAQTAGIPPIPIPGGLVGNPAPFEGAPAVPRPVKGVPQPPRHPFMAPNGRSNIHDDAYQTDTYASPGPLGDGAEVSSLFVRECASVAFDSRGRIVTVCVGLDRPVLALLDPHTLETLAALPLPLRNISGTSNPFTDFSGGGYFYLDHRDRAVVATNDRRVLEVAITTAPGFEITREYALGSAVAADDGVISVLPDWSGRLWFVTRQGVVGTIDRSSGAVDSLRLKGEGITNSFAVDETGGVFVVSDRALYRFDAGPGGGPKVTWRRAYPNSGVKKPSQSDAGSGTTPSLMGRRWVAITDNDDPMNVRVYERGKRIRPTKAKQRRIVRRIRSAKGRRAQKARWRRARRDVCSEPVFRRGAGATDQSLIVAGRSIVTENNYGYSGLAATELGGTTEPGLARVDVVPLKAKKKHTKATKRRKTGRFACWTMWVSEERAPSVVPKLSLANGLVYTYTKPAGTAPADPWYLTALDFRTGATVYRRLSGEGLGFNNNYAPVTLGPDGTAYVGVLGGLVAFR
jgi:hypothetical protein